MRRFLKTLRRYAKRPWFLPFICFLAFIDLFIIVLPTEGMIMTTTIMRPRRWILNGVTVSTASSLGAVALSLATLKFGTPFVTWIAGENFLQSAKWISTQKWIDDYGFWAVFISALGPLPQQPVILVAAFAGLEMHSIFLGAWLGRLPKYTFFSYLAARGEKWLRTEFKEHPILNRFPGLRAFLIRSVHDVEKPKN